MSAVILPTDPMIDVLTDAIASKRTTIAALAEAQKATEADLDHLRVARARLLAKAAGVEVGGVFLVSDRCAEVGRAAMVTGIRHAGSWGSHDALADWLVDIVFDARGYRHDTPERQSIDARDWRQRCLGVINASDTVLSGFRALLGEKGKAA